MTTRPPLGSPAASPPRLPDRYDVRRHVASGGMAAVWCAEDRVLGRKVAVKVLAERFAHDQFAVRRFKREARAAARVSNHPHVVTVYDVGDLEAQDGDDGGRAFMVMEYLAGGTVADAIRVGAVGRQESLRWLAEAASALDHAHARGIVHRDIKPANFLLDRSRVLHVADFGIARLVSEDTITSTDQLFGTAAYLAPEQALGQAATGASDRYALAVAAFELLAGERPFTATPFAAQARQHIEDPPPAVSERDRSLPEALDGVLARGMAKQPEERFATAGEFVQALRDAMTAVPAATRALPRTPSSERRRATAAAGAAAAVTTTTSGRRVAAASPRTVPAGARAVPAATRTSLAARRRGGRAIALAGLLVVAIAIAAVALAAGGNRTTPAGTGRSPRTRAVASADSATQPKAPARRSASASASATSTGTTGSPTTTANQSAVQLQLTGHDEMLAGDYQTAIPILRQAVSNSSPTSLTYAYALYDLGRSLVLSGDPSSAIPVLQQRLKINNQTGVVRRMLDEALRASGQAPQTTTSGSSSTSSGTSSTPAPTAPGPSPGHGAPGHGHGRGPQGPPNGGAGLTTNARVNESGPAVGHSLVA